MSTVIAKCRHNPEKYCKNWNGKGNIYDYKNIPDAAARKQSCQDLDGNFNGQCPSNIKTCEFKVTPTPSPSLKAS